MWNLKNSLKSEEMVIARIKPRDPLLFKSLLLGASDLLSQLFFMFRKESLELYAMDDSKVILVRIKLERDAFSEYFVNLEGNESKEVGIMLEGISKILWRFQKDEELTMSFANDVKGVTVHFDFVKNVKRHFKLRCETEPYGNLKGIPIPASFKTASVSGTVDSESFNQCLGDALITSSRSLTFSINENTLNLNCGTDHSFSTDLENGSERLPTLKVEGTNLVVESMYGIEYLLEIFRFFLRDDTIFFKTVSFSFGTFSPFYLHSVGHSVSIEVLLAPRVKSDGDEDDWDEDEDDDEDDWDEDDEEF
jgi:hypothetical protein